MNREQLEKQVIQDFKETFATEHGLRTLERLGKFCKKDAECYAKGDTYETAYNSGRRSVILLIQRQLNRDLGETKQRKAKNG